jgi:hypothetical protein
VPGSHLNDHQVRTYMDHRRTHLQLTAATKAGISDRSGRRIDRDPTLPSQRKKGRAYRTRANPFEGISEAEIVPLVRSMPSLQAHYDPARAAASVAADTTDCGIDASSGKRICCPTS